MTPCTIPEGQPLTEFCMTCGHPVMIHKVDRTCSACNIITALDLPAGSRVLLQAVAEDLTVDDCEALREDLEDHFPGVTFVVLREFRVSAIKKP